MKRLMQILLAVLPFLSSGLFAEDLIAMFAPPKGWREADKAALPPSVKVMYVGKGKNEFPPSINLGTECYKGNLKEYLKLVKEINDSQGFSWKDLGKIHTKAGSASLSQADTKTAWGDVRMMHLIFLKDEIIYILTAAALKNEFSNYCQDFFNSLRSFEIKQES